MRRSLVFAAMALLSLQCNERGKSAPAPAASSRTETSSSPDASRSPAADTMIPEDISYVERSVGGARLGDRLPMLVVLHGKLGSPEDIGPAFEGLHTPARLILPRGVQFGRGFVWWDLRAKDDDVRAFAAAASEAARRMAAFVRRLTREKPTLGKPVFAGFSQGAVLTYSVVVREPDLMDSAFPLSGTLPDPLIPTTWRSGAPKPTIHAFHGIPDPVVPIGEDRAGVAKLQALGVPVTLREYPNLLHSLGPLEMRDVLPEIEEALRREAASKPSVHAR
jgi:phospholipase/carboxylesterase